GGAGRWWGGGGRGRGGGGGGRRPPGGAGRPPPMPAPVCSAMFSVARADHERERRERARRQDEGRGARDVEHVIRDEHNRRQGDRYPDDHAGHVGYLRAPRIASALQGVSQDLNWV